MGLARLVGGAAASASVLAASARGDSCSELMPHSFIAFTKGRFAAFNREGPFEVHVLGETGWSLQGVAPRGDSPFGFPRLAALRGGAFAVEDARNRTNVFVDEGRYSWKALPVLDEALVGFEAHGTDGARLLTAYRGDGCAGVCVREYAVSASALELAGQTLLPAQADTLNIAVDEDVIAYVNKTDAELEGYQVVVRSRATAAAAQVSESVLPQPKASGQYEIRQLVVSGDQVMLRTGAWKTPNVTEPGGPSRLPYYLSTISVFRKSSAAGPYELIQTIYDSSRLAPDAPRLSAASLRVSGKRMSIKWERYPCCGGLGGNIPSGWDLLEFNGTAWVRSEPVGGSEVSDIGFAGDRVVYKSRVDGVPFVMTIPGDDCASMSTVAKISIAAACVLPLCFACVIARVIVTRKRKRADRAAATKTLAVAPADL
jgi:hypothetical protein